MRANKAEEVLGGETNILAQSKLIAAEWKRISPEEKQVCLGLNPFFLYVLYES